MVSTTEIKIDYNDIKGKGKVSALTFSRWKAFELPLKQLGEINLLAEAQPAEEIVQAINPMGPGRIASPLCKWLCH